MMTRFKFACIAACAAVSACADTAYDLFKVNATRILEQDVAVISETVFSVGKAISPQRRGDAVGYSKAADDAVWNLGEQYREDAPWPKDIQEAEKNPAWLEFRANNPERFSVIGMQRIYSIKTSPDTYVVVLAFPQEYLNFTPPRADELQAALKTVRDRQQQLLELAQQAKAEADAAKPDAQKTAPLPEPDPPKKRVYMKNGVKVSDSYDEDMML